MSRSRRALLALAPAVFALVACGRLAFPPVPDGEPVELTLSRAATTWTDTDGGTLELKPDGTVLADRVCSDHDIIDGEDAPRSGSGTWESWEDDGGSQITVSFDTDSTATTSYLALRDGGKLKLWTYVGDPDDGSPLCVLIAPAG